MLHYMTGRFHFLRFVNLENSYIALWLCDLCSYEIFKFYRISEDLLQTPQLQSKAVELNFEFLTLLITLLFKSKFAQ